MKTKPSDHFLGAVLRGYEREKATGKPVTPAGIWNQLVMECLHDRLGFQMMFAWDASNAQSKNRIGTIMETIKAGYVPGLFLSKDAKGRIVVEDIDP